MIQLATLVCLFSTAILSGVSYGKELVENDSTGPAPFWSFRPLKNSDAPHLVDAWCAGAVDQFILRKLAGQQIRPNASADRSTLIRRAYFDLIGLPPSPDELDAFLVDSDPHSYERMIDNLLSSRHFGERWARHWMDVARFAESSGFEHDSDRPHAYHYRDFLIRAINNDMPYDQFVRWQLAGDELSPTDPAALMATGFLTAGVLSTQITETEFERARYDELDDMVTTTGVAFLALSVGCARCHDHKYDPIPTTDYYHMASVFTRTIRSEIDLILPESGKFAKVQVSSEGLPKMQHAADGRGYPHFYEQVHFLERGDVTQKGAVATPGFLQVLARNGKTTSHWITRPPAGWKRTDFSRASLAKWITDPRDGAGHLAARVIVNRLWQHHMGRGIVPTPNDFGSRGERPTHPELLDWLASELIAGGWRLKRIHKIIMMSSTYKQSSQQDSERAAVDPENQLYWHKTPRRLEAEAIRDAMLVVAGVLDKTMFGPGSLDESMRRRSVYFTIKRSKPIPMMFLLDWPEHLVSIGQRASTTTAPQALLFLNNAQGRSFAQGFASRLRTAATEQAGSTIASDRTDQLIDNAYKIALNRDPSREERAASIQFLADQSDLHRQSGLDDSGQRGLTDFCQALMSINEFVFIH